jgi:hypothetical protein
LHGKIKKDEIAKSQPGITREKFLYNLSRGQYEKEWGTKYRHAGVGTRVLAFVVRILPKVGPFRALSFRTPTPETEKLFMASFNATLDRYRALLQAERTRRAQLPDENLDVGKPTRFGMYKLADETYAKLLDKLAEHDFAGVSPELKSDILDFYKDSANARLDQDEKESIKRRRELEMLRGATAYSKPMRLYEIRETKGSRLAPHHRKRNTSTGPRRSVDPYSCGVFELPRSSNRAWAVCARTETARDSAIRWSRAKLSTPAPALLESSVAIESRASSFRIGSAAKSLLTALVEAARRYRPTACSLNVSFCPRTV